MKSVATRRSLFFSGGALGAALLAAGCGATASPNAPAAPKSSCSGAIEFVSYANVGTSVGDGLVQLAQDFTAAHPGCSPELVFIGGGNTAIMEKLVAAIAGGAPPPVALVPAQQTPLWISKGVIQSLDAVAKRDSIAKHLFFESYWPQMVVGGKLWRLPFNIDVNFPWFLNKQAFRAAGLSPDQPPRTIAEVDALAAKLTREEVLGFVPWQLYGETNSLQSWAYAFGGDFYDPAKDKVIANHPKTVDALEWMVEWARRLGGYDAVQAQIQAMPNWSTGFANGRIAMAAQTSSALTGNLRNFPDLAVQGGLFPGAPGVQPGEATWLSGRGVGVVTGAADLESAWTFVKWLGATNEGTLAAVNRIGAVPGLKSSPGLGVLEKDPAQKPFVEALRAARHNPPGALLPINVWAGERGVWVRDALQQKIPARRALDEVTRTAQLELDQARTHEKR